MRAMVEYHAGTHTGHRSEAGLGGFNRKVTSLVGPARERGVAPGSPEAVRILDRPLDGADAGRRAYIWKRVAAGAASQSDRYHELLAVLNGERARPSRAADLEWLLAALDGQPT
ncbi:MAG TPA: hypothetical protein VF060_21475 [Trebonia sp.]